MLLVTRSALIGKASSLPDASPSTSCNPVSSGFIMNPDPQVPRAPPAVADDAGAAPVATSASAAEFSWLVDAMDMLRDEDGSGHHHVAGACLGPDTGPVPGAASASASSFLPGFPPARLASLPAGSDAAPALTARARIAASVGGCVDDFDALTCLAGEGFFPPPPLSSSYHGTNTSGALNPAAAEPPSAPFWADGAMRAAPKGRRVSADAAEPDPLPSFHPVVEVEDEGPPSLFGPPLRSPSSSSLPGSAASYIRLGNPRSRSPATTIATTTTERRRSTDSAHRLQIEALANSVRRRFSSSTRKKKKKVPNPAAEAAAQSMAKENKRRRISALFGATEDAMNGGRGERASGVFPSSAEALFPSGALSVDAPLRLLANSEAAPRRSVRTIFRSRLRTSFNCDDEGGVDGEQDAASDSSASASDTASLSSSHLEALVSSMQRSGTITLNSAHPSTAIVICNNDVICGTGAVTSSLIGNRRFEVLVELHQHSFDEATDREGRGKVASSLVDTVRGSVPSGRFIKLDVETGFWGDVGDEAARVYAEEVLRGGRGTAADPHRRQSSALSAQSASTTPPPPPPPPPLPSPPLPLLSLEVKGKDVDEDGGRQQVAIVAAARGSPPMERRGSTRAMAA